MTLENGPIVSVEWLAKHLNDNGLKVIDVRPREHYLGGHIPGAISVNVTSAKLLSSSNDAIARWKSSLEQLLRGAGIEKTDTIIAYEDFSGTNSAYAVWLGDAAGLAGTGLLDGGLNAWLANGQPIAQDPVQPVPSNFTLDVNDSVVATAADLAEAIANDPESIQIVDSRADQEFLTATIPGARHLEWMRHLNPDGTFRSPDELRNDYVQRGFDLESDAPIATFCGSGLRAAHAYVVLKHLGVKQPQNYGPSWSEWSRQPQLPMHRPNPSDV